MIRAGIITDDWKLPVFRRRLSAAGYAYTDGGPLGEGMTLLQVETEDVLALTEVIAECVEECANQEPKA